MAAPKELAQLKKPPQPIIDELEAACTAVTDEAGQVKVKKDGKLKDIKAGIDEVFGNGSRLHGTPSLYKAPTKYTKLSLYKAPNHYTKLQLIIQSSRGALYNECELVIRCQCR